MNLKIFKCYIFFCRTMGVNPSWEGLKGFKIYYLWECENYGGS
ncbi:hypothetical protein [Clostridium neonatale]